MNSQRSTLSSPSKSQTATPRNLAPETGRDSEPDPTGRPLLIIDDDADSHFFLKRQLKHVGIGVNVVSVFDGDAAVKYFERCMKGEVEHPSMVFLDIKMPGMNGFDVLEWIKDYGLLGKISVAMLTSSDDPRDVARAMSLGAHTYLTKPPTSDVLASLVSAALRLALLIVDDSAFARKCARRVAESLGFDVVEAADGESAITLFQGRRTDFVLLDMVMSGGMYGAEVLTKLRHIDPAVRVIVVTADTQLSTEQLVRGAGATALINKPLSAEKLSAVLIQLTSNAAHL
jgi:two-component system, chemotaxis family, chemotaxis protein CheY